MSSSKASKVYLLLGRIPAGKVTTYKELASAAGTHPRAIGMLMKCNNDPAKIPCYKVVRSDGSLGGYSAPGGVRRKAELLEKDGIHVSDGRIDLKKHLYAFRNLNNPRSKF